MDNNGSPLQWGQLRTHALHQRGRALLGPSTATNAAPTLSFTARYAPTGQLRVIVDQACDLADDHDLSVRIARACLDDDPDVAFAREPGPEVLTTPPTKQELWQSMLPWGTSPFARCWARTPTGQRAAMRDDQAGTR